MLLFAYENKLNETFVPLNISVILTILIVYNFLFFVIYPLGFSLIYFFNIIYWGTSVGIYSSSWRLLYVSFFISYFALLLTFIAHVENYYMYHIYFIYLLWTVVGHLQVKDLTEQFPAAAPLALVLKQFLADRSLDQSYSGGLSSYCLVSNATYSKA